MMKTKYLLLPLLASSSLLSHMALANNHWPDLPIGVKNGVSAQIGSKVYVGLGSAEKSFYVLDTQAPQNGWTLLAEFIGPERSGATATVVGENIFVLVVRAKRLMTQVPPLFLIRFIALIPRRTAGIK